MKKKLQEIGRFFAQCKVTRTKAQGAMALTMNDVADNAVVFEVNDESEIVEGTKASPDGTFTFANGKTITIEGGVVTKIEIAEEPNPENNEKADEQEEIDKDARIAELEEENRQLREEVATLRSRLDEMERDNEENAKALAHLEKLAKSIQIDEHKEREEVEKRQFSFKKK